MVQLIANPVTRVWIALMVITVVSTWVLAENTEHPAFAATAIMVLAAGKVLMIMSWFMELKDAPIPAQIVFAGWALLAAGIILGFYAMA